eukprot:5076925-Ditylum_brightwellii.AAC.1
MKEAEEAVGDIVTFTNKNDNGNDDEKRKEKDITCHERYTMAKDAFKEYDNLPASVKKLWEMQKRQYLERQLLTRDDIIRIIRSNPKYHGMRWVTSRDRYRVYTERIVPLLTPNQKESHLNFAILGGGKYLLIMYDERWFWGLVARAGAKACDEIGIDDTTENGVKQ